MRNATLASFILLMTLVSFLVLCACSKPPVTGGPAQYNIKMYHYQNMEDCPYDAEDWQHNRTNANNHGRDAGEAGKVRRGFTDPKTIEDALGLHRRAHRPAELGGRGHSLYSQEGGGE